MHAENAPALHVTSSPASLPALSILPAEFTQALEGTIQTAKAHKYVPTYFMQMLAEHGGVETAKRCND